MNSAMTPFTNPFRPGAGHMPPYLAGRQAEIGEFSRLLGQNVILENLLLTGLRGVGKTVLLETLKPIAIDRGWLWVGTDLSESASINERNLAVRLLTDLSVVSSTITVLEEESRDIGFLGEHRTLPRQLDFEGLLSLYDGTPGLVSDKLKAILRIVWSMLSFDRRRGIVFAYDEAQNLGDHSAKEQFPLSVLLDVFQSVQRQEIPFMLVLTGLPTLFPKLVESRTFSERMFRVLFLDRLSDDESREAIVKPVETTECPVRFNDESIESIVRQSGGYPYFIQFICREAYDIFIQKIGTDEDPIVPLHAIVQKLDTDFFAGRWARATDRQRDLLKVIAQLESADSEFTVQEIVTTSREVLEKPFSSSHVNQMLSSLAEAGLVYRNRRGKYSFAVPLLGEFILRQIEQEGRR